jgi:DNA modification methylase
MGSLYNADCLTWLKGLPDGLVHTCVTSPPYYGLRNYGVDGQVGLEPTPEEYCGRLVEIFREVRRVLRPDGTLWLNLGDSYNAAGRTGHGTRQGVKQGTNRASDTGTDKCRPNVDGLKPKDLIGIPWMVAFALRADGWYLRQDIIWHKPNPMPESVKDRCTKAHEYIFLMSKSEKYFFDSDAMKEPVQSTKGNAKSFRGGGSYTGGNSFNNHAEKDRETNGNEPNDTGLRNRRSVWTIPPKPFSGAHFATFPPDLIEPCILAGCPEYGLVIDPFNGAGTTPLVAQRNNRMWLSADISTNYCDMTVARLEADNADH